MAEKRTGGTAGKMLKKKIKKLPAGVKALMALCLLAGLAVGSFACITASKKDCFDLKGEKAYSISVGDDFTYEEEGVTAICFGRDVSGKLQVETSLQKDANGRYIIPTEEEGVYSITYTVDSFKFGKFNKNGPVKRVRTFTVNNAEEDGRNE